MQDESEEPWAWDSWGYESNFANQMRERREAKGWSQTEMARRLSDEGLKFHQTTVQRVEAGQRPLKLTEAMVIANVLNVQFELMLRGDSIELAYNELVNTVNSGAFDFVVRSAETIESRLKNNADVTQELIDRYTHAVAALDEDADPENYAAQFELLPVAREFVGLNDSLYGDAHSLATLLREARNRFDRLERNYPAQYDTGSI